MTSAKVVAVGRHFGNIGIARLNTDGSLDTTFAGDGTLVVDLGGTESPEAVQVHSDGKIVVTATTDQGGECRKREKAAGAKRSPESG